MARKIVDALEKGHERLFPRDRSLLGAHLYRLAPRFFMKQTVKSFCVELETAKNA